MQCSERGKRRSAHLREAPGPYRQISVRLGAQGERRERVVGPVERRQVRHPRGRRGRRRLGKNRSQISARDP